MNAMVRVRAKASHIAQVLRKKQAGGLMLKQWRYALLAGLALAITLCMSACGSTTTASGGNTPTASANGCVSGNLVVGGSTALQPLVTKVAKDYTTRCTGATITVQGGGSSVGKANV